MEVNDIETEYVINKKGEPAIMVSVEDWKRIALRLEMLDEKEQLKADLKESLLEVKDMREGRKPKLYWEDLKNDL